MKLALGTVQLGIPYGIANQTGMPDDSAALDILHATRECGYEWLDTAATYGQSQSILGRLVPQAWAGFALPPVATKIVLDVHKAPQDQLTACLEKLARPSVDALMLHLETDLDHPRRAEFEALGTKGRVVRLGVSCYTAERALQGIASGFQCLQVPCNLFDTSSLDAGVFQQAKERGVLVFVRSIFLQGLFFLTPDHPRAQRISGAAQALRFLHDFCQQHAVTPAQLAMAFGATLEDALIVLGADTATQVRDNARLAEKADAHRDLVAQWLRERPAIPDSVSHTGLWPAA